jgi:hypothetical protein
MNNGITYFRFKSPYEGDTVKNCGLEGSEIDNNFYVLESRDVKAVSVDGDDIVLTLYDGKTITGEDVLSGFARDLSFEFDTDKGVLYITQNGETTEISGFAASGCCDGVATDSTLVGNGTKDNPLGVAGNYQTGHYKPVIDILDISQEDVDIPTGDDLHIGDRYVIKQEVSTAGLFYDYRGVIEIACRLCSESSEWRVPTRGDWNKMLNAIEPDKSYANHGAGSGNVWEGKYAGKLLKSPNIKTDDHPCGWDISNCQSGDDDDCCGDCGCGESVNPCIDHDCGHETVEPDGTPSESNVGSGCYGFNVEPMGYIDNVTGHQSQNGKRAYFWTATAKACEMTCDRVNSAFIKGFDSCRSGVWDEEVSVVEGGYRSLRLVKDYDKTNYRDVENILGVSTSTTIVPEAEMIWTDVNVSIPVCECHAKNADACSDLETIYYIIEWDGSKWNYKAINEGEIVTVLDKDAGYPDYKLVDGELVVNSGGTKEDIDEIRQKLAEIESKLLNNHDFSDLDDDGEYEQDTEYTGDIDGGDAIKLGVDEDGKNIYW